LPPIIQYDREVQNEARKEIEGGQCKVLSGFSKDYLQLRDRLRLVRKELK